MSMLRKHLMGLAVLPLAVVCLFPAVGSAQDLGFGFDEDGNPFILGQAIITFRPGTSPLTAAAIVNRNGGDVGRMKWFTLARTVVARNPKATATLRSIADEMARTVRVYFDDTQDVLEFCSNVKQDMLGFYVSSVTPNYMVQAWANPDDPFYRLQWGVRPNYKAPTNAIPFGVIGNFPNAWDITRGFGIRIAILDTGVDLLHEDLRANILNPLPPGLAVIPPNLPAPVWPFPESPYTTFDPAKPWDDNGHGTHVAGIAAAKWRNKLGIVGAAPEATLLPVKVLGADGGGTFADLVTGIIVAVANGAKVLNMSLGGGGNVGIVRSAIVFAHLSGAVPVVAMGNTGGQSLLFPAAYPGVVSVGSHQISPPAVGNIRSIFSTFGPWITLVAPGGTGINNYNTDFTDIFSTFPSYTVAMMTNGTFTTTNVFSKYSFLAGTSMAAPHVAGAAALLLERNRFFTTAQVWHRFARFSTPDITMLAVTTNSVPEQKVAGTSYLTIGRPFSNFLGYGLLDAYRTLVAVEAPGVQFIGGQYTIVKGIPMNYCRIFPWSPRNHITGVNTLTPLQAVDRVFPGTTNTFRVIMLNDRSYLLKNPRLYAKFIPPAVPGLVAPADLAMFDDGAHDDLLPNDGIFGGIRFISTNYTGLNLTVQYIGSADNALRASNAVIRVRVQ
jgi:subtilisin family serine protease